MSNMLQIKNLSVSYGGIEAIKNISLEVEEGKIVTLIGSNGAGKSSTLRSIAGIVKAKHGEVLFEGENILGMAPDQIVKRGITLVPEGRHVFPNLTVLENLKIGAYLRKDNITDDLENVYSLFPRLKERSWQLAGTLSGGEQQMLAMGRALLSGAEMVVMDEPSMGLSPLLVSEVFEIVKTFRENGKTVLLVEQNAKKAMSISDRVYVMETGKIVTSGNASELINDESIKKAYLGE